ncbi:hypothetical protein WME97_46295 [Sorangium sp. So ce367]|uniref:hypothetical protein n=1 Tax=Sorangium sp. So ce367 TaxID=3133305 RepID=UPI003F5DE790
MGFEGVDADVNLEMAGTNPAISGRQDDSVTAPAVPSVAMEQAALANASRPAATPTMLPVSSPRQVIVATLTQTIAAAHTAGDLATAQIAVRILSELSAPRGRRRR